MRDTRPFRIVPTGVSREVIDHHGRAHPCPDAPAVHRICPCGRSFAICCGVCDEPIFVVAPRGSVMCEHLHEVLDGQVA